MAETFRRGKIIDHTKRLISRKEIISSQMTQNEFSCIRESLFRPSSMFRLYNKRTYY